MATAVAATSEAAVKAVASAAEVVRPSNSPEAAGARWAASPVGSQWARAAARAIDRRGSRHRRVSLTRCPLPPLLSLVLVLVVRLQ